VYSTVDSATVAWIMWVQYGLLKFDIRNTLSVVAIGSSCTTAGRTVAEMVAATAGATATITPCIYRVTEHAVHRVILAKAHFTFTASKSALVKQRMFCNIYEQLTKLCQHNESHIYVSCQSTGANVVFRHTNL